MCVHIGKFFVLPSLLSAWGHPCMFLLINGLLSKLVRLPVVLICAEIDCWSPCERFVLEKLNVSSLHLATGAIRQRVAEQ
jgi:hypothetical protein